MNVNVKTVQTDLGLDEVVLRERLPDNYDPNFPWIVQRRKYQMRSSKPTLITSMKEWCAENITGDYHIGLFKSGFERHDDAMLFYIAFR